MPRGEGRDGAPPGQSVEERAEAEWPAAAAGLVEEEWEEVGFPVGLRRVAEEVEEGEEVAEEGGCWS